MTGRLTAREHAGAPVLFTPRPAGGCRLGCGGSSWPGVGGFGHSAGMLSPDDIPGAGQACCGHTQQMGTTAASSCRAAVSRYPCVRANGQAGGLITLSGRIPCGGGTRSIILPPGQRPRPADPGKAGCSPPGAVWLRVVDDCGVTVCHKVAAISGHLEVSPAGRHRLRARVRQPALTLVKEAPG